MAPTKEPLQKSHMSRVSGAMAPDARPRLPTAGAANSSCYSQAAQQRRWSHCAETRMGRGLCRGSLSPCWPTPIRPMPTCLPRMTPIPGAWPLHWLRQHPRRALACATVASMLAHLIVTVGRLRQAAGAQDLLGSRLGQSAPHGRRHRVPPGQEGHGRPRACPARRPQGVRRRAGRDRVRHDLPRHKARPHPSSGMLILEAPSSPEFKAGFERFGFDEHEADPEPFRPQGRRR
jgi:hypothetical protein